jgi:hypothetical protein
MAGITGSQDYWIVGSRFYFEPNLAGTSTRSGEMIDLGTVDTISPQISTNIAELKDSESGVIILLDQGLVSIDETYSISVKNFNFRNLQILFAGKPQAETQAATTPATITLSSEELSKTPWELGQMSLSQRVDTSSFSYAPPRQARLSATIRRAAR